MTATITEDEFRKLCDRIYEDREGIYPLNPNESHRDALLWMVLGSLVSLLSVPILEQPSTYRPGSRDPYGDAICELLEGRTSPRFDPRECIEELSAKI